ncbi:MAG TPA: serine hydrolase domain-containing protein [Microbacteriaceae bacterium]|jgi:CubicO group peptidase (beta-lactamase class C family)|nr:serine hydrolase domain-containing protein [Microbacteriaceae bacterium]HQX35423.1 serine hydrolase domain-containing protein [Microbacteriaceae bacterium]HQZ48357.1 serine hydrolase domain-containing protein [Microbacteriaceae bacterium]HRA09597.1 serine hydrolase domain-containing protein [Microbacteriaceae bacterium]
MTVHGHVDERFSALSEVLDAQLESGEELGAAISVNLGGQTLVDVWGGYADAARTIPWGEDTIVNVWSTTKEITALAILMLVEQGLVDLDAPVATYWPEFAQHGKHDILVKQVMSHTSGVSGWDQPFVAEDMYDWEKSTSRLAAQAPWWEPGTASGYHAQNQGHLLGEIVRRVSGLPLKQFVAERIAAPLGVDLQIGAKAEDDDRVAEIIPPPPLGFDLATMDPTSPTVRTLTGPVSDAALANTIPWRRADMGALNGHTNARALARTFSTISLGGEVDGARLLSPATIERIFEEQSHGPDLVLGVPLRFGIGFALPEPTSIPYVPSEKVCFWGGWGGSMTLMFPDRGLTVSYVMNRMAPGIIGSDRAELYLTSILSALD